MPKQLFNRSDFFKNVTTLITGTVLAQLIALLLQPVLSRIYTPEEFGTFTIYLSIIGMLAPAGNLKYEGAIVLPDTDKKASALTLGSIIVSFLFSILWLIIFFFFDQQIIDLFNFSPSIKIWLLLIPLGIFIISSSRALNFWLIRQKAFKAASLNKVARRSSEGAVQFGIGKFSIYQGLIIGSLFGEFINLIVSFKQSMTNKLSFRNISRNDIKSQLINYKEFPIISFLPSLMDSISLFLPTLVISKLYDLETTGQFGQSKLLLSVPLAFISVSIAQVLIQNIAESTRNKTKIVPLLLKITLVLSSLSIIGIIILELFGVRLFMLIFGDNWKMAGQLSQILVFSFAIKFVVSPLTAVFTALQKIKISSIWQVGYFIVICSLFLLKDLSIEEFLTYYIIIDLIAFAIYYALLIGVCINYDKRIIHE